MKTHWFPLRPAIKPLFLRWVNESGGVGWLAILVSTFVWRKTSFQPKVINIAKKKKDHQIMWQAPHSPFYQPHFCWWKMRRFFGYDWVPIPTRTLEFIRSKFIKPFNQNPTDFDGKNCCHSCDSRYELRSTVTDFWPSIVYFKAFMHDVTRF